MSHLRDAASVTHLEAALRRRSVWVEVDCDVCEASGEMPGFISEDGAMLLCMYCDGGGTLYVSTSVESWPGGPIEVEREYNVPARPEIPALPPG